MKIYTDTPEGFTVIHNTFIDQYMPCANGEYVKVYLYLLRCANTGRELSLSSIADVFDHTEKDIRRALSYWEKRQLLRIDLEHDGTVRSITFSELSTSATLNKEDKSREPLAQTREQKEDKSREHITQSQKQEDNKDKDQERLTRAREQKEIRQLFYVAEQYLQRPLTSSEQRDFIYYYDNLQFSTDLIEYLLEYCISKGSPSRHYMRKVALAWAEAGVSTVLQAKRETNLYNRNYFTVLSAFGIKGRNPAEPELKTMARWFDEFAFTMDIILEACRRTILQTHQPNFQYADKILEQWHSSGVTSLSDIEKLDQQHAKDQKKTVQRQQPKALANRFNNFSQREYDYTQLEKQLLKQ